MEAEKEEKVVAVLALRMTEEEFAEWKKRQNRTYTPQKTSYGSIAGASPTCCQPARPSGVTLEFDPESAAPLEKERVSRLLGQNQKKRPKYGNRKVEIDGLKFDSEHEAAIYQQLMLQVRAGELKCVIRQVKFDLGGGYHATKDSRYQYIADFVTIDQNNVVRVLDAKSEITRQNRTYINKRKQMQAEWGLEVEEV